VRSVTTLNSKNFHVNVLGCENLTFKNFIVRAPENSPNTDGIHIGRSREIHVLDSNIKTGDDCVSIGDGVHQLYVSNVVCGPGHGISLGSLGRYQNEEPVSGVYINNCTLINTTNGIRVKTWPDSFQTAVSDMHVQDIHVQNVMNPIIVDQRYCPWNQCSLKVRI
jgi:galacturan 1,4-alpha-galacturonidase